MKNERFTQFHELCLEICRTHPGSEKINSKEALAWALSEEFPPTGAVLLGDLLLTQRVSFLRKDIKTVELARSLLQSGFEALNSKPDKDHWDHYYLGVCHSLGRGTSLCHHSASLSYKEAAAENPYAEFESAWSDYLAGGSRLSSILRLRNLGGKLQDFAKASAHALTLLELGPVREPGSHGHVCRLLELARVQHTFLYHNQGTRALNIEIEKEFYSDIDTLLELDNCLSNLAVYLIARSSRANRTGQEPAHWLRKAVHPENDALYALVQAEELDESALEIILDVATANHWETSALGQEAARSLKSYYE